MRHSALCSCQPLAHLPHVLLRAEPADALSIDPDRRAHLKQAVVYPPVRKIRRVLQLLQCQIRRDDQGLAGAVAPVHDVEQLCHGKLRTVLHAKIIEDQKAWQEQQARALGSAFQNPDNLVFTNEFGRFVANQAVYRNYKSIMKKSGLEDMKFHDLRHTFAVNSLKAGDDIKTVQENLGHATASFTLGTYAHATIGMKRESAKRMENYIQSLRKSG